MLDSHGNESDTDQGREIAEHDFTVSFVGISGQAVSERFTGTKSGA
jgi:hypothetical protein